MLKVLKIKDFLNIKRHLYNLFHQLHVSVYTKTIRDYIVWKNWPRDGYSCPTSIMLPYSLEELREKGYYEIIGPDTALWNYQLARLEKDWEKADDIVAKANKLGYKIGVDKQGLYIAFYK